MQYDDHVTRRKYFFMGLRGIASAPNMDHPWARADWDDGFDEVYTRPYYDDLPGFAK